MSSKTFYCALATEKLSSSRKNIFVFPSPRRDSGRAHRFRLFCKKIALSKKLAWRREKPGQIPHVLLMA